MRYTPFLAGILAVTASALPGAPQRRDAPSSSSSPSSSSAPVPTLPPMDILCEDSGKNKSTWQQFRVGLWLGYQANKFAPYDTDFPTTLAQHSEGVYDWSCEIDVDCHWKINGNGCMEGGSQNKQNYFILTAVQNFHNWIQSVLDSIQQTQIDFASQSMSLTDTFIDHEIDSSAQSWLPSVMSGFLGAVSAAAGPFSAGASTVLGVAGGAVGTEGGVASATAEDGASVIQDELSKMSGLEDAISNTTGILRQAVKHFGESMINETPDNSEMYTYGSDTNALPQLLKDGDFAEKVEASDQDALDTAIGKSVFSAAISYLWYQDWGYIVNVSRSVYDIDPCTYETDYLRECDDSGRAYIFLRENKDPKLKGYGDLGKYNVDGLELAESSGYLQSKKGYEGTWENDELIDEISSGSLPNSVAAFLPVCHLDDLYPVWLPEDKVTYIVASEITREVNVEDEKIRLIARNACPKQWINGKKWPLAEDDTAIVTTTLPADAVSTASANGVSFSLSPYVTAT
ncbi:hypothetical protein PHISP_00059 [Aspergillus sp. HF37]|nr:hypothetical protein PHISP_00059 [Aspergillus sp. HF37]